MKKLQCELCGSIDIVKVGADMFQCQHCGCKYTADEAKKILFGDVTFKARDFEIVGGKLVKYNGESPVVVIPNTVSVIGMGAFEACSGITKVTIPNSVKSIEGRAFANCSSLKSIVIPDSVTMLGSNKYGSYNGFCVFSSCESLESIQLSRNLEILGYHTFENCTALKEIVIPEGIKIIKWDAFEGCSALKKITLPYSLQQFQSVNSLSRYWSNTLTSVEGNSRVFFDAYIDSYGGYDSLLRDDGHLRYNTQWDPIAVCNYVEQIVAQRRAQNKCVNCGGTLRGVFKKQCTKCGRSY